MSEDPEIEKIKQRKLEELLRQQSQSRIELGVINLNGQNFDQTVSAENPTLIDFWAEWCGPCKMMHPVFESMSEKYPGIKFARVNVDQNQDVAMRFRVQSIPTFLMFKAGKLVDRMVGAVGTAGIQAICKKHT